MGAVVAFPFKSKSWSMMKQCLPFFLGILLCLSARAEIIYDNSQNYLGQFNATTLESGDQIELSGQSRLVTEFAFEYFGNFAATGDETARLRFYLNDGLQGGNPSATPNTLLYDSGAFTITTGFQTITVSDLSIFLPTNTFTWTVQFAGLLNTEKAGVLFYDPPQVGRSGDYLWRFENGQWAAVASANITNNLVARVIAVPELRASSLLTQAGAVNVSANTTPGKLYSLEFKTNVTDAAWEPVNAAAVRATTNRLSLADPAAANSTFRLYRVVERDASFTRTGTQGSIVAFTTAGKQYALEGTTDFRAWSRLQQLTATTNTVTFTTPINSTGRQFFRVSEL